MKTCLTIVLMLFATAGWASQRTATTDRWIRGHHLDSGTPYETHRANSPRGDPRRPALARVVAYGVPESPVQNRPERMCPAKTDDRGFGSPGHFSCHALCYT